MEGGEKSAFTYTNKNRKQEDLSSSCVRFVIVVYVFRGLPNLENVVFGDRCDHPVVVLVPREIGNLRRVATVNEKQLRRPILSILRSLVIRRGGSTAAKTA